MAKSQESKKEAAGKTSKKSEISEERVVDSDSEGELKAPVSPAKPAAKETKKAAKAIEKKTKKTPTKKAASPTPPPPKPATPPASSSESDDESDDESTASESAESAEKAVPVTNGIKRKADDAAKSSSSSEDDDEDEDDESSSSESLAEAQPVAKKVKTTSQPAATKRNSVPSNDESNVDKSQPKSSTTAPTPAKPFAPPKDFTPLESSTQPSVFPATDLSGKQLWHITAPSSLPISAIISVAQNALSDNSTVLTHKDTAYTLLQDKRSSTYSVLLPNKEGYTLLSHTIDKTLHLQQKVELPLLTPKQANVATGSEAAADVWRTGKVDGEAVRPQPKGMRMRYKPPGFGAGECGLGSDDDREEEEVGFRLPGKSKSKKKRESTGEAMEGVEKTQTQTEKGLSKEERKKARKEAKRSKA